jgi:hypothetical protein
MCGELVCGLVHHQVIALGTTVAGTTRRVVVGITVAVIGANGEVVSARLTQGKSVFGLVF